jgi:hypothetical protein
MRLSRRSRSVVERLDFSGLEVTRAMLAMWLLIDSQTGPELPWRNLHAR